MALKLTRDLGNGYQAEYFRIGSFSIDVDAALLNVTLLLYKDEQSRRDGKEHIKASSAIIIFPSSDDIKTFITDITGSLACAIYCKVKESEEYTTAIDC
jgi:hypothetical protein